MVGAEDAVVEGFEFWLRLDGGLKFGLFVLGGLAEDEGDDARFEGWVDPRLERRGVVAWRVVIVFFVHGVLMDGWVDALGEAGSSDFLSAAVGDAGLT